MQFITGGPCLQRGAGAMNVGLARRETSMRKYYQLSEAHSHDYGLTAGPTLPDGSVLAGKMVAAESLPELIYEVNVPDDEPCPHFMTGGTVIVSERFIQALVAAGATNFQQFPALLLNPETRKRREGFFLFNVLGLAAAADLSRSSYDTLMEADPGDVPLVAFQQVVLDGARAPDLRMFRLAEDPCVLVVDEVVLDALKEHRPEEGWGITLEELDVA